MRKLVLLATLAAVAGCGNAAKVDRAECLSYGFKEGTQAYAECRMLMASERRRSSDAMGALGIRMLQPPPSSSVTCRRFDDIVTCN